MVQKVMHWMPSISKQDYEESNHGAFHCSESLFVLFVDTHGSYRS